MSNDKFDPHKHPGPLEDLEKQSTQSNNSKVAIIIAVLVLLVGGGIAMFVYMAEGGGDVDEAVAFVPFLPIWIAVFIPLFIKKKKKGATSEDQKRIVVFVAVGIAILVALTAGLLLYKET